MKYRIFKNKIIFAIVASAIICVSIALCNNRLANVRQVFKHYPYVPKNGFIPNEETAVKIAEAVWLQIYGEKIYNYKPYKVQLNNDSIWSVEGVFQEPSVGGVPYVEIQKSDGKILIVAHGK